MLFTIQHFTITLNETKNARSLHYTDKHGELLQLKQTKKKKNPGPSVGREPDATTCKSSSSDRGGRGLEDQERNNCTHQGSALSASSLGSLLPAVTMNAFQKVSDGFINNPGGLYYTFMFR